MAWSTSTYTALFIKVDELPTWIAASAIEALTPDPEGRTFIYLAGGKVITTDALVEDIIEQIRKAQT